MKFLSCVLYIAILGIAAHFFGEALPRDMFDPEKFPFRQFSWEKSGKVYRVLRVKQWKDKMPDASRFYRDMVPKRVVNEMSFETVHVLLIETCVAEFTHLALCVCSIGVCLIWEGRVGVFLWILCIIGNVIFIIIQRYNRPHLMKLSKWLKTREERLKICAY